ncbi:MAG: pyridoxal phosphate-dependent aminotransferase [Thermoanaerobaculia bacterium]|nr:pyridoxal phosphate-dependent aminotransferase [Thermoanaerobaculia bacterium]
MSPSSVMESRGSVLPKLSRRAGGLAESATMEINRRAGELRAAGHEIIDLSAGEPDFPTPPTVVEAARRALSDGHTRYTAAAGLPDLRDAVAARYAGAWGAPWTGRETVVTVGAKAALFEVIQVLVDEGDEVVMPSPAWVSFEEQIRFAGGTPVTVPTDPKERFALRAQPLLDAITERTRMVLVNSPCNPTGGVATQAELEALVRGCVERGVYVLSDETYELFVWHGEKASVAACAAGAPDNVILIGSFSKTYAMTGWRLGWLLGPPEVVSKVIALQSHATSNPTTFAMYGALEALRSAQDDVDAMIRAFAERRSLVAEALDALPGVHCAPADGAFYAFPDVSEVYGHAGGIDGSIAICARLLEAGVALVPGIAFGDDRFVRLSFAASQENLRRGIERMAETLDTLHG